MAIRIRRIETASLIIAVIVEARLKRTAELCPPVDKTDRYMALAHDLGDAMLVFPWALKSKPSIILKKWPVAAVFNAVQRMVHANCRRVLRYKIPRDLLPTKAIVDDS